MDVNNQDPQIAKQYEQKLLSLLQSKPNGISDKDISSEIPELQGHLRAAVINKFLKANLIALFKNSNKTLVYKLNKNTNATKGADQEEKIVYSIIQEAGNIGIWNRDIRFKCNLPTTQLNKIIKNLEMKKYIKAVKSVSQSKKKVYMLYDIEPDSSVTGGAWYQEQQFEVEFVDVLNQQCYRYLEQKRDSVSEEVNSMGPLFAKKASFATAEEVNNYITKIQISKINLTAEDLEMILCTLIYDGKVEKNIAPNGDVLYRAVKPLIDAPGLVKSTCGVCPVRKNCFDFDEVTPIKCQYISEWLDS